jgi:hypothetical protein
MKQNTLPWMAVCLGWLLAFPVLALDINETLPNVRILAVFPGNVVVLSRGLEDDVTVGTHAKLRASEGYAARALCVKSGLITSHWRIYRIVEAQLISKDLTYSLIGMDASEAPRSVENWQRIDHEKIVPAFNDDFLKDPQKAPAEVAKSDLPEDLKDDEKKLAPKTFTDQILERNYDPEKLRRDFKVLNGAIYASPWSLQKGGETSVENMRFGGKLANEGKKYILATGIDRTIMRAKEGKTGEKVVNEGTEANATFTVKELNPTWDGYTDVTFRQARFGRFSTPKGQFLIAPLGFTKHFSEGKTLKRFFASYAPTYDTRTHEGLDGNDERNELEEKSIRHAFRLFLHFEITPDFMITSDLRWRPAQDIETWGIDVSDNLSQERLTASWRLVGKLFVDYEYQWLDDAQLHRLNSLPRVVTTNSLNIRYNFGP